MATINLGSIKFNWQGAYAGGTAYAIDDVVSYNGSSYVCILASTGNLPTNATYFEQMSSAGTDGTDLTSTLTTQGDILYRDGSGLQRLGAGTSGQALLTGGTGANPSWGDVGGGLVQTVSGTSVINNSTSSTSFTATSLSLTITPTSSSNKIILLSHFQIEPSSGTALYYDLNREIGATNTLVSGDPDGLGRQQDENQQNTGAIAFRDTPNTTSQIIYTVHYRSHNGSTVYFGNAGAVSSIVAMEVSV